MTIPHDLEAEESVIGACLLSTQAVEAALPLLTPSDFYKPSHGTTFDAIERLHKVGAAIDELTVADKLKSMGVGDEMTMSNLISLKSNVPAISSVSRYAMIVSKHSLKRSGIRITSEALNGFSDPTTDPGELLDSLAAEIKSIDSPALERVPEDIDIDEFMDRPTAQRAPWVVEGLLREGHRAILVGREGSGKSVLCQSIGVCAAYGVHPFSHRPIKPASVLVVDLENPDDVLHERMEWFSDACRTLPRYETERRAYLWHRPGGINLRKRTDRIAFEDVIRRRRPNLVILGPLYKAYSRMSNENDEQVAAEVQNVLDDLRTRYSFALLIEHHAPKGGNGTIRDLVPFGSSLWLRWSELGFSLVPEGREFPDKHLDLEPYRGDRVKHAWPKSIDWGSEFNSPFAWKGNWEKEPVVF